MKKLIIILLACFILGGCKKNNIVFDNSDPLALSPLVSWAVVVEPYVAFRADKSWESQLVTHCRKGDVLLVKGKAYSTNNEIWYKFEDGWLHSSFVRVYSNKYKAKTASKNIGEK